MQTARYWHREGGKLRCDLCPHACLLAEGGTGRCRSRAARGGTLMALGYGMLSSVAIDPMEKKPLYHFRPGSPIFSIGGWGCNLSCVFCQNWTISQQTAREGPPHTPESVIRHAVESGAGSVAYTYNEPLINIEFVADCAREARKQGLANVLVTNGYVKPEPAAELLPLVQALNLDIKSMDDAFYRERCGAGLKPVLDFAVQSKTAGCHIEITNLLIPGWNDEPDALRLLAAWIRDNLGDTTPLHLSAYHPAFRCDMPPTPLSSLLRAHAICAGDLAYVYLGNVVASVGRDTLCPGCGAVLMARSGFAVRAVDLDRNRCRRCGRNADIVTAQDARPTSG